MRIHYLWGILIVFFLLSGCISQTPSFAKEDITSINIEGCGLDGFFDDSTAICKRKVEIDDKKDIEFYLAAIESATEYEGPLTAEGNNFVFTVVNKDDEAIEYLIWLNGENGSFEKPGEDGVRYLLKDGDAQKIYVVIESEIK